MGKIAQSEINMGSPNFYTATNLLNVGFDFEEQDDEDLEDAYCSTAADANFCITEIKSAFDTWLNEQGNLYFHNIVLDSGYYSGIQIYLEPIFKDRNRFIEETVVDWNKYKEFSGVDGYQVELEDCAYFRSDLKNITAFELDRAIKREHRALHNALLDFAKEQGMGEVVGSSWTSSLSDAIVSKRMVRLC